MTIASRNRFIRIATLISLALLIMSIASTVIVLVHHGLPETMPGSRPLSFFDGMRFMRWSPLASLLTIGVYPLFSLLSLLYILFAFEKTQTVEITFFAACAFSVSLEAFRVFIPLYNLWQNTGFYAEAISRIAFCGRFLTLLLLLSSSIYSTGKSLQQVASSIFLLTFFSFSLANAIPVNTGMMASNFLVKPGYESMINFFFLLIGLLSSLSYLILGKTRAIPEYTSAAGGVMLFLIGYSLLAGSDSWILLSGGSLFLFWGAWIYLDRIHRYYLWQ